MLVLDCSAAMSLVLETEDGRALAKLMAVEEAAIAPYLYIEEVSSALWRHVRAGDIDVALARELAGQAIDLIDEFVDPHENYIEALDEGVRNSHSTYDMFYLTLARRNGATLFTLDRKLIALCEKLGVDCMHVFAA